MVSPASTVQACVRDGSDQLNHKRQDPPGGANRTGMDQGALQSTPVNSSVLQGQARCEMADGRWQQGTPASVSTGCAGWWTGGAHGGASKGKGTMKTIIACCNLYGVREMAYSVPSPPAYSLIVFSVQIVLIVSTVIIVSIVF